MKNYILVFLALLGTEILAQQLPVNCDLAVPGCSTPQFPVVGTNPAYNTQDFGTGTISNPSTNPSSSNSGCLLSGETVSTFVTINVVTNGTLEWSMIGATGNGCFDWIMWESTAANGGCAGINGNTLPPVTCNWNGNCNANTGMAGPGNIPPNGDQSSYEPAMTVTAGQSFILCLSNYSFTAQLVDLNFFGTAAVSCTPSTPDQTICEGETATVNIITFGMPSPTYNWIVTTGVSNVSSGTNVSVTPTVTTQYIVEISSGGTVVQDTFMINVVLPPTPNAGPDAILCLGQPIPLNGVLSDVANTFNWTHSTAGITPTPTVNYLPNAATLNPNVVVNQPGTYTFTLSEDNVICPIETDDVEIIISSTTHTTTFIPPSCPGQADASITIINPDAVDYSFDGGLTYVSNATINGLTTGTYNVISRNQYDCIYVSVVTITEAAQLFVFAGNDTLVCENGTANLWANTSAPALPVDYHWSHDPALTANATVSPTADMVIYVFAEGPGGCMSDTAAINITVREPLSGMISPFDTICPGYPTTIGVNTLAGGIGSPYDIVWSSGEIGSGSSMDIQANPATVTTYTATITDACESTPLILTTEVFVGEVPVPLMADAPDLCEPAIFELINLTDPATVQSYVWNISDGQTYSDTSGVLTDEMPFGAYSVQLVVTSPNGCVDSAWFYDWLVSYQTPQAEFNWSPNPVQMFNTTVNFSNQSFLAAENYWTFEEGNPLTSTIEKPTTTFPSGVTGEYLVTLYVTSEFGCVDSISHVVPVLPEVIVYAPNTFTPDGDEFNQKWQLFLAGVDVMSFQLEIYNRWGDMVWESRDINVGWDGTYDGEVSQQGTYTWKASARDASSDKKYVWTGHINILR